FQFTTPVVRRAARFHANFGSDRYTLLQRCQPTPPVILAAPLRLVMAINAVHVKCVFCDINADPCNLHFDFSFGLFTFEPQPSAITRCRLRRIPSHCTRSASCSSCTRKCPSPRTARHPYTPNPPPLEPACMRSAAKPRKAGWGDHVL